MKLAITGASGKTGFRVAEEALAKGYSIRLLVRRTSVLPESLKNCERVNINLFNPTELQNGLEGCDSLIIATGARPSIDLTGPARIDAIAVQRQVEVCKKIKLNRIILVSSLCAGKFFHPLNLFGLILIWKKIGESSLQSSGLDWTIIRPGGLNENEDNLNDEGIYFSSENKQEEGSIPRRLVARSCIESLNTKSSLRKIIEITSNTKQQKISMEKALNNYNKYE
tara:strand:- start:231 stop:905 length:675 start_codon:yes stop_codon:yes gene_type:complete